MVPTSTICRYALQGTGTIVPAGTYNLTMNSMKIVQIGGSAIHTHQEHNHHVQ